MQEGDTSNYLTFKEDDNAAEESITLVLLVFLVKKKTDEITDGQGSKGCHSYPTCWMGRWIGILGVRYYGDGVLLIINFKAGCEQDARQIPCSSLTMI